ncbi:MAG TPA: ATP phosphoribosyltransferase regulatory subunit, partial [Vicinamibacteria bacterium]
MQPLKGFRDFYPEEMARRNDLFDAWRRVAKRFGFVEFDGPPLESLELYTRKSGEEIVEQLYTFEDKGGRAVALRPEMTPTLARMMAARASTLPKPIKWFSIPQLFRYERNQRGRLREHFQLNVDIVGAPEVEADVELLAVAIEIQRELGLQKDDVVARVNDRRVVQAVLAELEVPPEIVPAVYAGIDKFRKVPRETFQQILADAGLSGEAAAEIEKLSAGETDLLDWCDRRLKVGPGLEAATSLARYGELLAEVELSDFVELDFSIVRGLAYYTGIV